MQLLEEKLNALMNSRAEVRTRPSELEVIYKTDEDQLAEKSASEKSESLQKGLCSIVNAGNFTVNSQKRLL